MGFVPDPVELRKDSGFVEDMARFSEGVLTERQVRAKYHLFDESTWTALNDDAFVEAVELCRTQRIRSGATKRELAQLRVVAAPNVLHGILTDPKANARARIDSDKALDDLAGFSPQRPGVEQDRVIIHIDMGADVRARGLESTPADVLHIEASARPTSNAAEIVDAAPRAPMIEAHDQFDQQEPVKRGPGRPKGSKNKPKVVDERPRGVPGFDVS
jgi:hypothetical protein